MQNITDLQAFSLRDTLLKLIEQWGNISGSELAKRVNLPVPTINRLLAGSVTDPRASTLLPIAEYFGISVDQLLGKSPLPERFQQVEIFKLSANMPLLSLAEACSLSENVLAPKNYFSCLVDPKNQTLISSLFAIKIESNDFLPVFNMGTTLVVNSSLNPEHSDYVLVKFKKINAISIKKFHIDPPKKYLLSLIPGFENDVYSSKTHEILGVITEAHTQLK